MKIRLYLAWTREVRPMLEMTPLPECSPKFSCCCADQKQTKSKNVYIIFFGGDVTICMYPLPPLSLFVTDFGYPLPLPWWRHFWMTNYRICVPLFSYYCWQKYDCLPMHIRSEKLLNENKIFEWEKVFEWN